MNVIKLPKLYIKACICDVCCARLLGKPVINEVKAPVILYILHRGD